MANETPEVGLVIRHLYLWRDEKAKGQEEGRKARPCLIVHIRKNEYDETEVFICPITHAPPHKDTPSIEIPHATKQRLKLDGDKSWLITGEVNRQRYASCEPLSVPASNISTVSTGDAYEFLAAQEARYAQALRLSAEYLEERPNDQRAQDFQINLLADMSRDDELVRTILEFQERDGYDMVVTINSMTLLLISDDPATIRRFAQEALRRLGDSTFVQYQAHRALLWARDIDGASRLVPLLVSSDMPIESRNLVALRQACAENKVEEAQRIVSYFAENHADDTSMMYISRMIMGRGAEAAQVLMELDAEGDIGSLADYLNYAFFDARQFPNLMNMLETQGIEPRAPKKIPYQCGV